MNSATPVSVHGSQPSRTKVAFVFDDGHLETCKAVTKLFERYGYGACLAVVVDTSGTKGASGDWRLWNQLQRRGHRILPHGYNHSNKAELPFERAVELMQKCLDAFTLNLEGFEPAKSVFCYPFSAFTEATDRWLLQHYGAVRHAGPTGFNTLEDLQSRILTGAGFGPEHCDEHLLGLFEQCLEQRPAAFIYIMHGVGEEGWGPVKLATLDRLLGRIKNSSTLEYWKLDLG